MTSHGCYLCLLLLSVILIEPSEAGCLDHFKEDGLTEAITKLPKNIPVKIMNKSEDIVVCSLKKRKDCINDEETCLLWNCFENKDGEDCNATYNKKDENISVPNFHFMCLTNITKHLHDKKNPPEVCKVYKKVCGEDSATPGSEKEISSEKETGSDIQTISIGVLITTNIIVPIAVYLYMRYQIQQIRNLREEEGMTEIQQNPFPTDVEEGSNLLMTPESSIIINSPENTII